MKIWTLTIVFVLGLAALMFMNNRFVQSMIYPVPAIPVPKSPPAGFVEPDWDLSLHAWLFRPAKPAAKQVILYFHGNGENLETMRLSGVLEDWQTVGRPFLVIDYPGYGRSPGSPSEEAILSGSTAAADWLRKTFPDHSVIISGWSLGAAVAVQTATRFEQTDALIALSAWTSLVDTAKLHFSEWLVTFALKERYDSLKAAEKIQIPALFIHGEQDDLIPAVQGKKVAAAIKPPAEWVLLPSTGHNDLLANPSVWKEIGTFLENVSSKHQISNSK